MSSLALYGDLAVPLAEDAPIGIRHRVEVVKLLPSEGPSVDPAHHAHVTVEAVARPEGRRPERRRAFAMAVTAEGPDTAGLPGDSPVAPAGGSSPFSRTSRTWDRSWPLKPDVALEEGTASRSRAPPTQVFDSRPLGAYTVG